MYAEDGCQFSVDLVLLGLLGKCLGLLGTNISGLISQASCVYRHLWLERALLTRTVHPRFAKRRALSHGSVSWYASSEPLRICLEFLHCEKLAALAVDESDDAWDCDPHWNFVWHRRRDADSPVASCDDRQISDQEIHSEHFHILCIRGSHHNGSRRRHDVGARQERRTDLRRQD